MRGRRNEGRYERNSKGGRRRMSSGGRVNKGSLRVVYAREEGRQEKKLGEERENRRKGGINEEFMKEGGNEQ